MNEKFILELLEKFDTSSARELEIQKDGLKIVFSKNTRETVAFDPAQAAPNFESSVPFSNPISIDAHGRSANTSTRAQTQDPNQAHAESSVPATSSKLAEVSTAGGETIKSPIVGTFYRSPSPDSPAYVEKGKKVKKGDAICILEAMKMMNTLEAEFDCVIEDILVQNGELVEFDQDLFRIKRM